MKAKFRCKHKTLQPLGIAKAEDVFLPTNKNPTILWVGIVAT